MFNQVTYNVVIDRLAAYAQGHLLLKAFTHGTLSKMVEALEEDDYPLMHVTPASVSYQTGERSFTLDVVFADIPRMVEDREEYEREIISDCIQLAEDLLAEIRNGGVIFGRDVTLEENIEVTPFIADYAHTLTGVTLSITLNFPYNWSACDIPADWSVGGSGSSSPAPSYGLLLKVNSNPNAVQSILDLVNGTNVTIEDLGDGRVRINSTGGGGLVNWGSILGTLSNQTDLQNALNLKADVSTLAAVATSGDYNDLSNLPEIPSIDGLVPYTGAAQSVNLGENKLTTESATDFTEIAPSYITARNVASTKYTQIEKTGVNVVDDLAGDTMNMNAGGLTFPDASSQYTAAVNADWNATSGLAEILNKPTLPPVIGDMTKAEYDTDADGVVDAAETIQVVVRNSTGSTLTKGQVVYLSGATGNRPNAILADASTEVTSSKTIGLVVSDIANNADGNVAVSGTLHDLDTSLFAAGDTLWLSETAGAWQANTPPAEPAHAVFIGYVARSHPNLGRVVLAIQNGYELNELHGVRIVSEVNRQVLIYDSTTGLWINELIQASDLPSGIDAAKIGSGVVSNTEFGYLDGVTSSIQSQINATQEKLISGTNIKTINSTTILGSGNFDLQDKLVSGTNIKSINGSSILGSGNITTAAQDSFVYGGVFATAISASTTTYFAPSGLTTSSTGETNRFYAVPIAGVLKNLVVRTSGTQTGTGSLVITIRKNQANTSLAVTITSGDGASPTKQDTTNSVSVAAGDTIAIQATNNSSASQSASIVSIAFILERT